MLLRIEVLRFYLLVLLSMLSRSGGKELAVSKRVGFVSYRKQNHSTCCAVSRRKLAVGALHVATVSAITFVKKSARRKLHLGFRRSS